MIVRPPLVLPCGSAVTDRMVARSNCWNRMVAPPQAPLGPTQNHCGACWSISSVGGDDCEAAVAVIATLLKTRGVDSQMRSPLQTCSRRGLVAVLASGAVISMSALTGGVAPVLAKPGHDDPGIPIVPTTEVVAPPQAPQDTGQAPAEQPRAPKGPRQQAPAPEPVAPAPNADPPKVDAPKADPPKVDGPQVDAPKADTP